MRSRRRIVLLAFLAALLAAFFAMPLLRGLKCQKAGGSWDRSSLTSTGERLPEVRFEPITTRPES
jgi:hypothetical protein